MILTLIWMMLTLTFILLTLGYWLKIPFVAMFGWTMLFLLCLGFVNGSIEYQTGHTEVLQGDNVTTITTYDYTDYNNNFIFIMMSIISACGFVSVFFTDHLWKE